MTVESGQRVFVGSASESAHIAEALHVLLSEKGAQVTLWSDAFTLSGVSRDTLVAAAKAHDFSVFVFSQDDQVLSRGTMFDAPRDNVIYELGLFSGIQGPERVFVLEAAGQVKIPTDLFGVTRATYQAPAPGTDPNSRLWMGALHGASRDIMYAIGQVSQGTSLQTATAPPVAAPLSLPELQPLAQLATELMVDAGRGRLRSLFEVARGRLVVHAVNGVGRVVGHDRLDRPDPLLCVRFDDAQAWVPRSELFVPPDVDRG